MWRRPLFGMSLKSISNCQWKSNEPVALEDESETGGCSALSPSLDASARPPLLLLYPGFRHLTTRVRLCGSLKVLPSKIGKHLDHCCGSTENVLLSTSAASPLLTDFRFHSGFRQECTQARLFRPRLIMAFLIDTPTVRRLSRTSNPSATQDPLM